MLSRRGFVQRIGAGLVGLALARTLPGIAGDVPALAAPPAVAEFQVGDVVTFAGTFAFDPITRQPTTHLQNFVVTSIGESGPTFVPSRP